MNKLLKTYNDLLINFRSEIDIQGDDISGYKKKIYVCIGQDKNIKIFIKTKNDGKRYPPKVLSNLEIEINKEYSITSGKETIDDNFSLICLKHSVEDYEKVKLFCDILLGFIKTLKFPINSSVIKKDIDNLIEIFQPAKNLSKEYIQGLWTELFLIYKSKDTLRAIDDWHDNANDRYDFGKQKNFIEVKSTLGDERKHTFSLNQVFPQSGDTVIIASFKLTENINDGLSLGELYEFILKKINGSSKSENKLFSVIYPVVTEPNLDAFNQSYDQKSAEQNLKFINLDNIPKLDHSGLSLQGISNIKFTSNLDFSEEIDLQKIKRRAKIFKNMIN